MDFRCSSADSSNDCANTRSACPPARLVSSTVRTWSAECSPLISSSSARSGVSRSTNSRSSGTCAPGRPGTLSAVTCRAVWARTGPEPVVVRSRVVVMQDHRHPVSGWLGVGLHPRGAGFPGGQERRQCVLRHHRRCPPMRNDDGDPGPVRRSDDDAGTAVFMTMDFTGGQATRGEPRTSCSGTCGGADAKLTRRAVTSASGIAPRRGCDLPAVPGPTNPAARALTRGSLRREAGGVCDRAGPVGSAGFGCYR